MPTNVKLPKVKLARRAPKDQIKNRVIQNITFFGDSAIPQGDAIYNSVYDAARALAKSGYTVVDGGGPGLMKAATDGAESVHGHTIAIYWEPKLASFFEGKNLANIADESDASSNYVMRTLGLIEKGDAYIVCKGGTGTVSEFGLVWCLAKLYYGCHKPVILYGDFWDPLIEAFRKNMYIDETELAVLYQAQTPDEIIKILAEHERKIEHCKLKEISGSESAFVLTHREQKTAETYDQHAQSYHAQHAGNLAAQEQLDEFKTLVNAPAKVLDIGCGPGFDTKYLSEKYTVSGLDISKRMVEIARYENPNLDIQFCDIVSYKLPANTYKGIWSRNAIHHIEEEKLDGVFKNIANALVQGGIFYMIAREGEGEEVAKDSKTYGEIERFFHYFSEKELIERAEKAGMKIKKFEHTQRSHKWIIAVMEKV